MAGKNVKELTDDGFEAQVQSGVTLVDFWAPWCGPCRAQAPILDTLADKLVGKATIAKVNVDEHQAAAGRFGIRSIPTLILFKDGKPVQQFVGVQSQQTLEDAISEAG